MPKNPGGVQWAGQKAVVKLPQHVDSSNAGQIRERLLWIINRGAVVLIADMSATLSCDYSGAEAVMRAYRRATASGTQLRLVVTADAVRRILSVNGLHRLVSMYPTVPAALAAGPNDHQTLAGRRTTAATPDRPGPGQQVPTPADPAERTGELLDSVVKNIFTVALTLQEATELPPDVIVEHITEAVGRLDNIARGIRDHMFAQLAQGCQPGTGQPPGIQARTAQAAGRATALHQRLTQTARAMHAAATETAALLTQRANLVEEPQRIDYPTEIKRWRVIAEKAEQIAERWEEDRHPDS
jgi:anti-sigma B factor antagonist